ncbi:MAG TPA: SDR family oxidoreductase [Polyangiaceae bacterium]|nr:SDR family oxidoreductase [Polyangiaceae bacterium]
MTRAGDRRVALVTGAGTRVGRSIALELKCAGYDLALHYQSNESGAREVAAEARAEGLEARVYQANLEDRTKIRRMLDSVLADFEALDLLVPNAAIFERIRFEDIDDSAWDRMLGLNLTSSFTLAHYATASLISRAGNIVFVTCSSVDSPYKHHLPYVVSKAGVYQLMRTMAIELAPRVRVNAVAPGTVLPPESMSAADLERLRSRIPLQRFGSAPDVARAVRFLAESPFITGQQIVVDGGRSLARAQDGS